MKMAVPLRSLWERRGLLAFSSSHPACGVLGRPGQRRLLCQQPSTRALVDRVLRFEGRRTCTDTTTCHLNHTQGPSQLCSSSGPYRTFITGCYARQTLTWKCRNPCFSLSLFISSNQPIVLPGLPKPIQAFVQVGRGTSSSRHFTSIYWKISIMYRFHENKAIHCLPPKKCQKRHTTPHSL